MGIPCFSTDRWAQSREFSCASLTDKGPTAQSNPTHPTPPKKTCAARTHTLSVQCVWQHVVGLLQQTMMDIMAAAHLAPSVNWWGGMGGECMGRGSNKANCGRIQVGSMLLGGTSGSGRGWLRKGVTAPPDLPPTIGRSACLHHMTALVQVVRDRIGARIILLCFIVSYKTKPLRHSIKPNSIFHVMSAFSDWTWLYLLWSQKVI